MPSCKEVFHAVCDQLAQHFEPEGLRYTRSRPRLRQRRGDLELSLAFWSSHSNIEGSWVCLETVASVRSRSLEAWMKQTGVGRNGVILSVDTLDAKTGRYENSENVWGLTPKTFDALTAKLRRVHWAPMNVISIDGQLPAVLPGALRVVSDSYACWLWMQGRHEEALAVPDLEPDFIADLERLKRRGRKLRASR